MQRTLDWVGMLAALLLGIAVARGLLADAFGASGFTVLDWAILVFSVPAGLLAADFVSGLAHWLADRVLSEDTPFFGPYFVRPFREHHRDPQGILFHDWVETNGNTCISAAPLLVLALVAVESTPGTGRNAIGALALSLAGWLCLTNQIHKWAHTESPSRWVRALQRSRLVLSPAHHARHHRAPHDVRYCITTGWANPTLDRMGFFALAERALRAVGLLPVGIADRRSHPRIPGTERGKQGATQ